MLLRLLRLGFRLHGLRGDFRAFLLRRGGTLSGRKLRGDRVAEPDGALLVD